MDLTNVALAAVCLTPIVSIVAYCAGKTHGYHKGLCDGSDRTLALKNQISSCNDEVKKHRSEADMNKSMVCRLYTEAASLGYGSWKLNELGSPKWFWTKKRS